MRVDFLRSGRWQKTDSLLTALGFEELPPKVIASVGAGGKTSTMYQLAAEFAARGKKAAVVTTTHMELPPPDLYFTTDVSTAIQKLNEVLFVVVGIPINEKNFGSLPDAEYQALLSAVDVLLVEADGSKRLPLKVPASHEPVIPAEAEYVIVVAGLSSVGKAVADTCHRAELVQAMLETDAAHCITAEDVALLLRRGYWEPFVQAAGLRGTVLLNQADSREEIALGKRICEGLGPIPCVLTKYN
ncbi:MAG TPA: selenium cofactor biosynthesis protein YqeC [Bellilinea sp.]|nr:selenium cofactor biosynthesis protein YqeC [Bellilinea sp.]